MADTLYSTFTVYYNLTLDGGTFGSTSKSVVSSAYINPGESKTLSATIPPVSPQSVFSLEQSKNAARTVKILVNTPSGGTDTWDTVSQSCKIKYSFNNSWNSSPATFTYSCEVQAGHNPYQNADGTFNCNHCSSEVTGSSKVIGTVTLPSKTDYSKTGYYYTTFNNGAYNAGERMNAEVDNLQWTGTMSITLTPDWKLTNPLKFEDTSCTVNYSSNDQWLYIAGASGGTGEYTYSLTSNPGNYFKIKGSEIGISGGTPPGTYNVGLQVKDEAGSTAAATWSPTIDILANSITIDPSTDVSISYDGEEHQLVNSVKAAHSMAYVGYTTPGSVGGPNIWYDETAIKNFTAKEPNTYYIWAYTPGGLGTYAIEPQKKFTYTIKPAMRVYADNKWNAAKSVKVYTDEGWKDSTSIKVFDGTEWVSAK